MGLGDWLKLSGLHSKCFYLLSHLTGPNVTFQVAKFKITHGQMPPAGEDPHSGPSAADWQLYPIFLGFRARTQDRTHHALIVGDCLCVATHSQPGVGLDSYPPMISMKICFQCSQVWKPRRRAEPSGKVCSCCLRKLSQRR